MEDITLSSDELLSLIIAVYNMRSNPGLTDDERKSFIHLTEKLKKIQASAVFSEAASMFEGLEQEESSDDASPHEHNDFEDEEYVFECVPARMNESFLFDDADKSKKIDVLFSLVKSSESSFIAIVDLEKDSLETTVESFKLVENVVHVYEKKNDKQSIFEVELLTKEDVN
jgi:hypothetical protein